MFEKVRKYFNYDDKLRRIVSIVTGILIIVYNIFSGTLLVHLISLLIFGIHNPDLIEVLLYFIPGMIVGSGVLKLCIFIVDQIHRGTTIEDYSYLRLILFVSVIVYLFIMVIYVIVKVISGMIF